MRELRQHMGESGRAIAEVFRSPNLRRLQLAWAGSITGRWAYSIAVAVYAYQAGGAGAVALVAVLRTVPAAFLSPFTSILGDRLPRSRVMLGADLARAALLGGAAAIALAGGPAPVVYVLAALTSVATTAFQPAQAALLPSLARSPEELTAANVSSSTIESVGSFAGPAFAGLVLALSSAGYAFAFTAATFLWSALMVSRLRVTERPSASVPEEEAPVERRSARAEALAGFRTIADEPKLRLIIGLYSAQTVVAGAASVLVVVIAFDLLGLGNSAVGYLNSASGVGGVIGAVVALALVGRRRLAGDFGLGIVLWGLPLLLIGLWPNPALALTMLGVLGLGNTLVDVAALTLLQRSVSDEVLSRVFGVMQSLLVATMGLGAIVAPLLVAWLGAQPALVITGAFLPILALVLWPRLAAIDRSATAPACQLELLRGIPIFAPLPARTLERLAHSLNPLRVAAGEDVVTEGAAGDRFYVVDEGEAEVIVADGSRSALGRGDYFGEIALLRDVPRTATVRARTDLALYALERDEFLSVVTGHARSRAAAETVIGERLGPLQASLSTI